MRGKDLTGRRFGRLVAVERTDQRGGRCFLWRCRCDCGQECLVPTFWLTHGVQQSCGCLQRENRYRDATGRRIGHLTAIRQTGEMRDGAPVWLWRCDCGAELELTLRERDRQQLRLCPECRHRLKQEQAAAMAAGIRRTERGTPVAAVPGILSGKLPAHNTSGVRGVSWHRGRGKWWARVSDHGRMVSVGYFDTLEDAARARAEAVRRIYGDNTSDPEG